MSYKEKDIKHEAGDYFVLDDKDSYTVFKNGVTHSVSDSAYKHDNDGLGIAVARCNFLANRSVTKLKTPCPAPCGGVEVKYAGVQKGVSFDNVLYTCLKCGTTRPVKIIKKKEGL